MPTRARGLCATLTAILLVAIGSVASAAYQTQHVFIVVMDGVRWSDTFGDPTHQNIPHLWNDLRPQGTLFTRFHNRGITVTRQGHSTMISGTWQPVANGGARLTRPTLMEYYRDEKGVPPGKCWSIFGKARYSFEPWSSGLAYGEKLAGKHFNGGGPNNPANENSTEGDAGVLAKVLEVMKSDQPDIVFINFGYTDHSGHVAKDIAEYQAAIKGCDEQMWKLWEAIQADPHYKDTTTVFFTNDHGRHTTDFHGHGDHCEGCEHIMLVVLGPDTPKGKEVSDELLQIDIAPTAGELLGIQTPLAEGHVIASCLTRDLGLNKKEAVTDTARQAVEIEKLASRDLDRVVADHVLASMKPDQVAADLDGEVLMLGVLQMAKQTQDKRYADFVRQWVDAHQGATETGAQLAVAGVALQLPPPARDARMELVKKTADQVMAQPTEGASRKQLLRAGVLLGRLAQVTKDAKYSEAAERVLTAGLAQPPPPATAVQEAARDYLLLGLAAAVLPQDQAATKAFLIASFTALRNMKEVGGLWDDPTISVLNLTALNIGRLGGGLRDVTRLRGQNAQLPASVTSMTEPDLRPLFPNQPTAPLDRLRRQLVTTIAQRGKQQIGISQDLLKYGVDEAGVYADGSPAAEGGFLIAFQRLDWRYVGNTWPGPR